MNNEAAPFAEIEIAIDYVLDPPTVPCHPDVDGWDIQYESQSTLIEHAQTVARFTKENHETFVLAIEGLEYSAECYRKASRFTNLAIAVAFAMFLWNLYRFLG